MNSDGAFKKKVDIIVKKVRNDDRTKNGLRYLWSYRLECFLGALVFFGILFAFFFIHLGGGLIGVGAGLCFHKELRSFFYALRKYTASVGVFKTVMLVALAIYLLLALPAFLFAVFIGFGAASFALKIAA